MAKRRTTSNDQEKAVPPVPPVNAEPSKRLLIDALTTDISLADAILDLADNSVDGARRHAKKDDFSAYWVRISFDKRGFEISDNCGGIPVNVAENYAFRFGRPKGRKTEPGLIGQYGVGMKRAIFKMGGKFAVRSTTTTSRFVVEEDLTKWLDDEDNWKFHFSTYEPDARDVEPKNVGTTVEVESLYDPIKTDFDDPLFKSDLMRRLQAAHSKSLSSGLTLTVGGLPVEAREVTLRSSDALRPAYQKYEIDGKGKEPVRILLYAGLSDSKPKDAGWYVYCNGRLVLDADQTDRTGWGETGDADVSIPKIHNQFAMFRGYAYFDCKDQERLPWTTTKTSVNVNSPIFKAARKYMVHASRPIINFLNKLDAEKDSEETTLRDIVAKASPTPLRELSVAAFHVAERARAEGPKMAKISYKVPAKKLARAKDSLDVTTNAEVGEQTFEYYYRYECAE